MGTGWDGYVVFFPLGVGAVISTPRETTQSTFESLRHWAHALDAVYLEGALSRPLAGSRGVPLPATRLKRWSVPSSPTKSMPLLQRWLGVDRTGAVGPWRQKLGRQRKSNRLSRLSRMSIPFSSSDSGVIV
jgi:hypothetical protein